MAWDPLLRNCTYSWLFILKIYFKKCPVLRFLVGTFRTADAMDGKLSYEKSLEMQFRELGLTKQSLDAFMRLNPVRLTEGIEWVFIFKLNLDSVRKMLIKCILMYIWYISKILRGLKIIKMLIRTIIFMIAVYAVLQPNPSGSS